MDMAREFPHAYFRGFDKGAFLPFMHQDLAV